MPQRAKTPPPPQDEVFMTIHYPYPQYANMELQEDVEGVARWLGSIVKPAYFNAFFHKPSARNTVIIEVSKAIGDDRRKLLGQHTWKDILEAPLDGEEGHRSGIFYCVFNTIRDVQKEGWKRIDFEDTWFMPRDGRKYTSIHYDQAEWETIVKQDGKFKIPYPTSTRCEVPVEDPTNRGFCRPLPVDLFPLPVLPEMPKEVPGTLAWARVKAIPESEWAKMPPKAIKEKSGSQKGAQPKVPRNKNVGPPVTSVSSGVNHKSPGSLPPNLVTNDKGKGKQKETGEPSLSVDELVAHTVAMGLEEEEDKEYQEYYGAGMESALTAEIATSPTIPPFDHDPIDHTGVGVHASGVVINPVVVKDSLWGDPLENINKKRRKEDDVPLCEFHGRVCSRGICKVYEKQLREYQKKQKDSKEPQKWRNGNGSQSNERGGTRGRGTMRGRVTLLRGSPLPGRDFGPRGPADENRAPRRPNGVTPPRNSRPEPNKNPGVNNAWGANNNAWSPSEMNESAKPVGKNNNGESTKPVEKRNPGVDNAWGTNNDSWSPSEMNESAKPVGKSNPGVSNAWGTNNDSWTPSEMGESTKPVEKPSSDSGPKDDEGGEDCPWNPPAAQDWSQSEIGGGSRSQVDPWSGPGKSRDKRNGTNNVPRGTSKPTPARSGWGGTGGAKDWTASELGVDDSVSQRGDDVFRTSPNRNPEKKSWADEVEDEMGYANGYEPAPTVAPEPEPEVGGGGDDGWVERGKRKGNGKGKGKAKSTTGWSDVTNQGFW